MVIRQITPLNYEVQLYGGSSRRTGWKKEGRSKRSVDTHQSVLLLACLAWPSVDGAVIGGGKVGSAIYPKLSLLTVMLLAPPLDGSKEIKLSSHGLLDRSDTAKICENLLW